MPSLRGTPRPLRECKRFEQRPGRPGGLGQPADRESEQAAVVAVQEGSQVPALGRCQEFGLRDQLVNSEPGKQELPVSPVTMSAHAPGYSADHLIVGVDSLCAPGVKQALTDVGLNSD